MPIDSWYILSVGVAEKRRRIAHLDRMKTLSTHSILMLTDKEVRHIAELARIKTSEKEEKGLKKDLSSILEYIEKLNEVDTTKVEPLYQTTGLVDSFREDKYRKDFEMDEELNKKLIGQAPASEKRFIKIKSVFSRK